MAYTLYIGKKEFEVDEELTGYVNQGDIYAIYFDGSKSCRQNGFQKENKMDSVELMCLYWTTAGIFPGHGEISRFDFRQRWKRPPGPV